MEGILGLSALMGLALVVLCIVLTVLWVIMPFVIIGMKSRVEDGYTTQCAILKELKGLRMEVENFRLDASEMADSSKKTQS